MDPSVSARLPRPADSPGLMYLLSELAKQEPKDSAAGILVNKLDQALVKAGL